MTFKQIKDQIFLVQDENFEALALSIFRYQYQHNSFYKSYVDLIVKDKNDIDQVEKIPFLPIQFFKNEIIISKNESEYPTQKNLDYFESSGTSGQTTSKHYILDKDIYEQSYMQGFIHFFGFATSYCILGLLPSYLERQHSSLVYMMNDLIKKSNHPLSGFYLHDFEKLAQTISILEASKTPTLLFGVSYALLDYADLFPQKLQYVKIVETGGMKGKREEMNKEHMHDILQKAFQTDTIYTEYGMTELFSQAYSLSQGIIITPAWMKILIRDNNDPLQVSKFGRGAINIVDFANINSCSFIATEDIGEVFENGTFKIHGRLDSSELRGCSLMYL